jgi:hypothetical protein
MRELLSMNPLNKRCAAFGGGLAPVTEANAPGDVSREDGCWPPREALLPARLGL